MAPINLPLSFTGVAIDTKISPVAESAYGAVMTSLPEFLASMYHGLFLGSHVGPGFQPGSLLMLEPSFSNPRPAKRNVSLIIGRVITAEIDSGERSTSSILVA